MIEQLDFILVKSHAEPAKALHMLGLESRIRLTLPHFMVAPSILATTDLAVIMPSRPAARFAERHALQVVEPDLGLPKFTVSLHWNWRFHNDPGNRWLREIAFAMQFGISRSRPTATSSSPATASRTRARSAR
jgi:DNA-binding transcriptional LysR family regulator